MRRRQNLQYFRLQTMLFAQRNDLGQPLALIYRIKGSALSQKPRRRPRHFFKRNGYFVTRNRNSVGALPLAAAGFPVRRIAHHYRIPAHIFGLYKILHCVANYFDFVLQIVKHYAAPRHICHIRLQLNRGDAYTLFPRQQYGYYAAAAAEIAGVIFS